MVPPRGLTTVGLQQNELGAGVGDEASDPVMAAPEEYGFTGSISKPFQTVDLTALLGRAGGRQA